MQTRPLCCRQEKESENQGWWMSLPLRRKRLLWWWRAWWWQLPITGPEGKPRTACWAAGNAFPAGQDSWSPNNADATAEPEEACNKERNTHTEDWRTSRLKDWIRKNYKFKWYITRFYIQQVVAFLINEASQIGHFDSDLNWVVNIWTKVYFLNNWPNIFYMNSQCNNDQRRGNLEEICQDSKNYY